MTSKFTKLQVGKQTFKVEQAHLKVWLISSEIYGQYHSALVGKNFSIISTLVNEYLSITTGLPSHFWNTQSWLDTVSALNQIARLNVPDIQAPILFSQDDIKKQSWDYPHRIWYLWSNAFARAYGWTLDMIENLSLDDAIGLFQEIRFDEQMEREFYYGLSEVAYPYDKMTKKSEFHPMPRPDWMRPTIEELPKVMLEKSMLPIGRVEDISKLFADRVIKQ